MNQTCFLTDDQILNLYTFSFNITETSGGYPPQCSNLTMSWPTSLESNVTGTIAKRAEEAFDDAMEEVIGGPADINNLAPTGSSSENRGNTTYPPSMFGVIPLGNSFSIPITYDSDSRFAKNLPASSVSDDPTTWTRQGVTYLNWTVPLAKGTRFILVAGIGSDQQWASGGSSSLLTVGQGSTGCGWNTGGDTAPSVTATTGTYTGDTESPTSTPDDGDNSGAASSGAASGGGGGGSTLVRTVLACVLSVLGTLLIVGVFLCCRRTARRRREAAMPITKYPLGGGSMGKQPRDSADPYGPDSQDMPLDLIASRDGPRGVAPIFTNTGDHVDSPIEVSPVDTVDSRRRVMAGMSPTHTADPRSGTLTSYNDSITSPTRTRPPFEEELRRQSSLDPLISRSGTMSPIYSPAGGDTYISGTTALSASRPLMLHDRTADLPYERGDRGAELDDEDEDLPELKRDTLAMGEASANAGPASSGRRSAGPGPGRRRRRDEELEYVVHRDAGRVQPRQPEAGRRVLELPPRYEELDWDGEEAQGQGHGREQEQAPGGRPGDSAPL